jgi:hypothetical protein
MEHLEQLVIKAVAERRAKALGELPFHNMNDADHRAGFAGGRLFATGGKVIEMSELEKLAIRLDEADKLKIAVLRDRVGKLVSYFREGQRFAKLIELKSSTAVLQREGHRKFEVPLADVKGLD